VRGPVATIALNTYREATRQPIYYLVSLAGVALILLSFVFTLFAFGEEAKLIKDMGLATTTLAGLLVALFASANVITAEIDKKTALTVLCKPVRRHEFILGKFLGIVTAVFVAMAVLTVVLTLSLGLRERKLDLLVLVGGLLSFAQVTPLAAIAVAVSTRFPLVVNVSFCFFLYVLGHLSSYLSGVFQSAEGGLRLMVSVLYTLTPSLENFNVASSIALGTFLSGRHLSLVMLYALAYTMIGLLVATMLFREKEVM